MLTEDDLNNNHNIGMYVILIYSLLCLNEEGTYQEKYIKYKVKLEN